MNTITIELNDRGGFEFKGVENLQSRSEFIQLMLAVRMLESRALEKGYLPELLEGLEERSDKSKDKVRILTEKEHENLEIGNPVSPTYIQIELPNNVPSNVKPIVILPTVDYKRMTVKVTQYDKDYTTVETTVDPSTSHVINLNMGV